MGGDGHGWVCAQMLDFASYVSSAPRGHTIRLHQPIATPARDVCGQVVNLDAEFVVVLVLSLRADFGQSMSVFQVERSYFRTATTKLTQMYGPAADRK